tara:strand:+ start:6360 stop:6785 length:426 start_codon:yes stop_codon:yes gene_type:complete
MIDDLFPDALIPYIPSGLECNNCGQLQPVEQFKQMPSGEIKRKCRTCARNQSQLVNHLKKVNAYPDAEYKCPICDRKLLELASKKQTRLQTWVLDHCHKTETFRGWLCFNCNSGLGQFKDNLHRLKKAVKYLESHSVKEKR